MYRAVTLYALRHKMIGKSNGEFELKEDEVLKAIDNLILDFMPNSSHIYSMYMNNENVENEIRKHEVSHYVSYISKYPLIRQKIVSMQKAMGLHKGVVMEGRDIASVVFPEAELKLFITASLEVRAQRRYAELLKMGFSASLEDVCKNLKMRDLADSTRENSPLMKVKDAILIDNTSLDLEEQFQITIDLLKKKTNIL